MCSSDLAYGVVTQLRAIQLPRVTATANHTLTDKDAIDQFPGGFFTSPDQTWAVRVQVTQSVYEGGKIDSAKRSAELTRDQAVLQHQTVVADTVMPHSRVIRWATASRVQRQSGSLIGSGILPTLSDRMRAACVTFNRPPPGRRPRLPALSALSLPHATASSTCSPHAG